MQRKRTLHHLRQRQQTINRDEPEPRVPCANDHRQYHRPQPAPPGTAIAAFLQETPNRKLAQATFGQETVPT